MFNSGLRKEAQAALKASVNEQKDIADLLQKRMEELFESRKEAQWEVKQTLDLINKFKNTPESLDLSLKKIKMKLKRYQGLLDIAEAEYKKANVVASGTAAAGVATGVGVAALAPSAAMAIATTFGTASTGTAISALSGAAAGNAALAWLGGGALATGGAGIGGGEALLALAGPVGWAIGATALVGGGLLANGKNKKAASKMFNQSSQIDAAAKTQKAMGIEVNVMTQLTDRGAHDLHRRRYSVRDYPIDFAELNDEQKGQLGTLVNNMHSAATRLNQTLGEDGKFHEDEVVEQVSTEKVSTLHVSSYPDSPVPIAGNFVGQITQLNQDKGVILTADGHQFNFKRFNLFDNVQVGSHVHFEGRSGEAKDIHCEPGDNDLTDTKSYLEEGDLIGKITSLNAGEGTITSQSGQLFRFKQFNMFGNLGIESQVEFQGHGGEAKDIHEYSEV